MKKTALLATSILLLTGCSIGEPEELSKAAQAPLHEQQNMVSASFHDIYSSADIACQLSKEVPGKDVSQFYIDKFTTAISEYNHLMNDLKGHTTISTYPWKINTEDIDTTDWCTVSDQVRLMSPDPDEYE